MKTLLALAVMAGFAGSAFADIQDPPSNDYGPTRKLGRGFSNFFLAPAEVFVTVTTINTYDGNSAAAGYGVVRGVARSGARHIAGLIQMLTFPFPIWRDSYYPMLPPDIPYIHAGSSESPPEIAYESKHP